MSQGFGVRKAIHKLFGKDRRTILRADAIHEFFGGHAFGHRCGEKRT